MTGVRQNVLNLMMGSAGVLVLSAAAVGSLFYAWFYQPVRLLLANFDLANFDLANSDKVQIAHDIQSSSH
jgi:hypothetical protein